MYLLNIRLLYLLVLGLECVLCAYDTIINNYNYWAGNRKVIPQDIMVEVVNSFGLDLLAKHNEGNDNNLAISPYGALSVLVALQEGVRGEAVLEIQKGANIPGDSSITRIGLRDIQRRLKSYFIPEEGFLSGLSLSHENVTLHREYEELLRFYGYDIDGFNSPLLSSSTTTSKPEVTTSVTPEVTTTSSPEVTTTSAPEGTTTVDVTTPAVTLGTTGKENIVAVTSTEKEITTAEVTTVNNVQSDEATTEPIRKNEITKDDLNVAASSSVGTTESELTTIFITEPPTTTEIISEDLTTPTTEREDVTTTVTAETTTEEEATTVTTVVNATQNKATEKSARRTAKRSIVDYLIARYYDEQSVTLKPPQVDSQKSFFINGKQKETNISYMTYDTVLPFCYITHLRALALRFPLDSAQYYLLLLLPEELNGIDSLIGNLRSTTSLRYIIDSLRYTHVKAQIPSFTLKGTVQLTPTLQKLGVKRVFEPRRADFSPMTKERDIYVTNIEQAITVTIRNYMDSNKITDFKYLHHTVPVQFKADHPFLYFVVDSELNVTLMEGKITNPLNSRIR